MNQKDAFFDTKHVMKDSNMKDGLIEEQTSSSNGMWLKLFSRLDSNGKSEVHYNVHGCPHLIAITSIVIGDFLLCLSSGARCRFVEQSIRHRVGQHNLEIFPVRECGRADP